MKVAQKDIVSISLNPVRGREQKGTRPAVVVSGNAFHISGLCLVCPLTTTLHHFEGDVIVKPDQHNNLNASSEILVGHLRSVSFERIVKKIGVINDTHLSEVFKGLDIVLDR